MLNVGRFRRMKFLHSLHNMMLLTHTVRHSVSAIRFATLRNGFFALRIVDSSSTVNGVEK